MTERTFYDSLLIGWLAVAAVTFVVLWFVSAPYGRHRRSGWGPKLSFVLGWILMESPAAVGMAVWFILGDHRGVVAFVFLGLWELHYVNRTFVYAAQRRRRAHAIPVTVVGLAILFNVGNSYLNGRWLFELGPEYTTAWLGDPRFLIGITLFLVGWGINVHADAVLLALRKPGDKGYRIPHGGLYRYVSCPNYFGEILEWTGWALATWSPAGLAFALWTTANIGPRAFANHRWYLQTFPDYPKRRKALIPFVV